MLNSISRMIKMKRVPSNPQEHGFTEHIPGFDGDATYQTIIEASAALEGSFIIWPQPASEA